jgi:hypothetical protein
MSCAGLFVLLPGGVCRSRRSRGFGRSVMGSGLNFLGR